MKTQQLTLLGNTPDFMIPEDCGYQARLRFKIIDILRDGKKPACSNPECGYDKNIYALEVDHIFGNGRLEARYYEKLYRGKNQFEGSGSVTNYYMFKYYLTHLTHAEIRAKLQILCANCNTIKLREMQEGKTSNNQRTWYLKNRLNNEEGEEEQEGNNTSSITTLLSLDIWSQSQVIGLTENVYLQ